MKKSHEFRPLFSAATSLPELTLKAIILAIILAILLAASNAYLALKIGMTISASIPASVLALGILRFFKKSNVLESNIVQTAASAGEGVASAVSFILPAMILIHVWSEFSYWETTLVTLLGGVLGVLFSVPLRRIMLNLPHLPFPEGTAIGNVLISAAEKGSSLKYLVNGGIVGGLVSLCQTGFQFISSAMQLWVYAGGGVFGIGLGLTPATLAAGYIIGIRVGITLLVGVAIGWVILLPLIASHVGFNHALSPYNAAMALWSSELRFTGVGTMLIGGVWTLLRLLPPLFAGMKVSFMALRKDNNAAILGVLRTERDISILWVINLTIVISVILYIYFINTMQLFALHPGGIEYLMFAAFCTIVYVIIVGFILAAICAYFTGLVGSTNNPLSGILIIALLLLSLLYTLLFDIHYRGESLAAVVILCGTTIGTIGAISNENLQDLKAGYMVGATPWKQQVMLLIGVVVASFVMAPVLNFLFQAYGIAGVYPRTGMDVSQVLPAPQASLMAAIVKGVFTHHLDWGMIFIGIIVGVALIVINFILKRWKFELPILAVGLGIYLPSEITTPIFIGGLVSYIVKRVAQRKIRHADDQKHADFCHRHGILLACGMVAGSALMGVILAVPFVIMGSANALTIVSASFAPIANLIGLIILVLLCVWFYRTARFKPQ